MFDKLKKAFSNIISDIGKKEITEKDLENTLFDLEIALLESDVAQEVIDDISKNLKSKLLGLSLEKDKTPEELIESNVKNSIYEILTKSRTLDLVNEITSKRENKSGPFVVVFLGINGTGKTTTVAKVANLLHKNGLSVVLAASDTHRAGAIEQLGEHARRLSLKMIHQRYGADPSAVARDAVEYGKKHRVDAILIDTAGRMQTAKNLMDEISKIVQVVKPDLRIFIGDSLAGNDAINQAKEFFAYTKFDGAILTKTDADAKGGAIISISYLTSKPIIYLGVGQNYDDIIPFNIDRFIESLFSSKTSEEITKKYDSTIINENKNNEKLSSFEPKSISNNDEATHTLVEELQHQQQQQQQQQNKISSSSSSSNLGSAEITSDIEMSKVEVKKDDKTTNDIQDNIINLKNESLNSKLEKTDDIIEDVNTVNESFTSVTATKDNSGEKSSVIEKIDDNKNDNKKGFFSSFFGKRKSKENNDKVSSNYDQMSNSSKNNNKNDILTANDDNKTRKNKNQEKNEIKYLSDDDLDELLKE